MKEDLAALSMALYYGPHNVPSYELERLWVDENGTVHLMDEKEDMDEKTIRVPQELFA